MLRFAPLIGFVALAALLAFLLLAKQEQLHETGGKSTLKPLPSLVLKPLSGNATWQQEKLYDRVTVLNFFASWCTPCATEMPELAALKKQFPDMHMVGVVWNDDPVATQKFLKQHGNPFDEIWLDPNGNSTIALGIKGIPESILVGTDGLMHYRLSAPLTEPLRTGEFGEKLRHLLHEAAEDEEEEYHEAR